MPRDTKIIDMFKGENGYTPQKGVDYFTKTEIEQFLRATTPKKGIDYFTYQDLRSFISQVSPRKDVDYFDGKDGRDGIDGIDGRNGRDGRDGKQGSPGVQGLPGEIGRAPNHKWDGLVLYFEKPNGDWDSGLDFGKQLQLMKEDLIIQVRGKISQRLGSVQQKGGGGAGTATGSGGLRPRQENRPKHQKSISDLH